MRIKMTVSKVITADNKVITLSPSQAQHVETNNTRFFKGPGDLLVVHAYVRGGSGFTQFYTTKAWSAVAAILDAAPSVLNSNQWDLS